MNDIDILVFGCTVTFIAIAGAYVILRERFLEHRPASVERERVRAKAAERAGA